MTVLRPSQLPPGSSANPAGSIPIDQGSTVEKVTPKQVVDAGRPLATQVAAETGASNDDLMSSLRVSQAIDAQAATIEAVNARVPYTELASTAPGEGAELVGTDSGSTVQQAVAIGLDPTALIGNTDTLPIGATLRVASGQSYEVTSDVGAHTTTAGGSYINVIGDELTPQHLGAKGDNTRDDTAELNRFAEILRLDDKMKAGLLDGDFRVTEPLTLDLGNTEKAVRLGARIFADAGFDDPILTVVNARASSFPGSLVVMGKGTGTTRVNRHGIVFDNAFRANIGRLVVRNVLHTGVKVSNAIGFSSFLRIDHLYTNSCGMALGAVNGFSSTWSSPVNSGASGLSSQRTQITVADMPAGTEAGDYVVIGGSPHLITAVGAGTLTLWPWIDSSLSSGTVVYHTGAGLEVLGADVGCVTMGAHVSSNCAVGRKEYALYPGRTDYFSGEFNGITLALGSDPTAIGVGGGIGTFYVEGNTFDLIKASVTDGYAYGIDTAIISDLDKCRALAPRLADNSFAAQYERLTGIRFPSPKNGVINVGSNNLTTGISFTTLTLDPNDTPIHTFRSNSQTITLTPDADMSRLSGRSGMFVLAKGLSLTGPSGTYTFRTTTGYTVNGGTDVAFSGLKSATMFYCKLTGTNWEVEKVGPRAASVAHAAGANPTKAEFDALIDALKTAGLMA